MRTLSGLGISAPIFLLCLFQSSSAIAQAGSEVVGTMLDQVQVTATRFAEPIQEVPESIEQITGEELRARGVNDLRTALALLGGVYVAPVSDDGQTGAVPGLLGTREADDFLLVVDGIPVGGAFIPQFFTLNLDNVERIEVQRGPASVFYGTTAFAGTINVVHYAAGTSEHQASVAYGSFGSVHAGGSAVLSNGAVKQSVSLDGTRDRFSDSHSGVDRGHILYRLGGSLAGGDAHLDVDATVQHQRPTSPRPRTAGDDGDAPGDGGKDDDDEFSSPVPKDFNANPADGKIDTQRYQFTGGFDKQSWLGSWGTTLALTQTQSRIVQGFLGSGDDDDDGGGADAGGPQIGGLPAVPGVDGAAPTAFAATGFHQKRDLGEVFFDTHLNHRFGSRLIATFGINDLYGIAHQGNNIFGYAVPADGSKPQSSTDGTPEDAASLSDVRNFVGLYTQARWTPFKPLAVLVGLRFNRIDDRRTGSDTDDSVTQRSGTSRLSGSAGVNYRIWQDRSDAIDDVTTYLNFANTFQPPQIDFGPEDGSSPLLKPESARSYQFGIKADGLDGRFSADLAAFLVDFSNQAIVTDVNGTPALTNGGNERFKGVEVELKYLLLRSLSATANASYNDARYRDFETRIEGDDVQLHGNHIPLSASFLAAAGLVYAPVDGIHGSLTVNFVGQRDLDEQNAAKTPAYVTQDATIGYRFRRFDLAVNGYNLSNRRDPALQSELGEGQYYLLPGRRIFLRISVPI